MILIIFNSAKLLLKKQTVMLHTVMMSEKNSNPFRIRLTLDAELQTQRPTKVPIQYRDNLNTL